LVISIVARFVARSEVNATVPDEVSETGDVHGWSAESIRLRLTSSKIGNAVVDPSSRAN
jgi:hypothetical protein